MMLEILLLILKILAAVLLGILGLFLCLVILLMIFPICYHVFVSYESELVCRVHVCGLQLYPKKERRKLFGRKKVKHATSDVASETKDKKTVAETRDEATNKSENQCEHEETSNIQDENAKLEENHTSQKHTSEKSSKVSKNKKEQKGAKKHVPLKELLTQIKTEIQDTSNQQALKHVGKELLYILRHCGPRRVKADAAFSLGDPANTGYVTAVLSVCPFSYHKRCSLSPDFEAEQLYIRGWIDIRGHVQLFFPCVSGVRLLMDRNIRSVLHKVQQIKK